MGAILVIEDDMSQGRKMTRVLTAMLRLAGLCHRVVWALNRDEALYHLKHQEFDLISVDGSFPASSKSESSQYFGLKMLEHLGRINYKGRVIFYSEFCDDVLVAKGKVISGKLVQAYGKISDAWGPLESDLPEASILEWTQVCVYLLKV